jgi:hypothetical protein
VTAPLPLPHSLHGGATRNPLCWATPYGDHLGATRNPLCWATPYGDHLILVNVCLRCECVSLPFPGNVLFAKT